MSEAVRMMEEGRCWTRVDQQLLGGCPFTVICKGSRRIYETNTAVYKVERGSREAVQGLAAEFALLRKVEGLGAFPRALELVEEGDFGVIAMERVQGTRLDRADLSARACMAVNLRLVLLLLRLSRRGIAHGDLVPHNIFLDGGRVRLIDLGHGREVGITQALVRNFLLRRPHPDFNRPYTVVLVRTIEACLPSRWQARYRRLLRIGAYRPDY